jgi:molybdopterin-containing oxidoreductase family membrane subunit
MNDKRTKIIIGLAILGLVLGSYGMVKRLLFGLNPVAFGSYVPWGLWVAFYLFFLGLSAGAFLLTTMTYVFKMERFKRIGPLAAFTVLITLLCEVLFITLDLGRMLRIYRFLLTPSFTSLMTWMFVLFNAMLVIYALKTFFLLRGNLIEWGSDPKRKGHRIYNRLALGKTNYTIQNQTKDQERVHRLSLISLPVGLIFYGANGAFFAILLNRPIWNSALTPLLFIVAALLSGGALITFLIHVFQPNEKLVNELGQVILFLLITFLFLEVLQFFVGYQSGVVSVVTSLNLIAFGRYWWSFWIIHLLIGSIIPLYWLIFRQGDPGKVAWACLLIVITFIAVRFNFVIPDLGVYKLEGLESAFFHRRLRTDYLPNLTEWLVSLWIVSWGILAFLLGARLLPLSESGEGGEKHA